MSNWLPAEEWDRIQQVLPILCVDLMPVRHRMDASGFDVGLILRETPHQGQRWCLIGGRVRHLETLRNALSREWESALGTEFSPENLLSTRPEVVEYRPDTIPGRPHDPRKHAVAATYVVLADGEHTATGGEALSFRWFHLEDLSPDLVGFGQETLVAGLLEIAAASER